MAGIEPEAIRALSFADFLADPDRTLRAICDFADVNFDQSPPADLPFSMHTLTPPAPDKWRSHEDELTPLLPALLPIAHRARQFVATRHLPVAPFAQVLEAKSGEESLPTQSPMGNRSAAAAGPAAGSLTPTSDASQFAKHEYGQSAGNTASTEHLVARHQLPGRQSHCHPHGRRLDQHAFCAFRQADGACRQSRSTDDRHRKPASGSSATYLPSPNGSNRLVAMTASMSIASTTSPATSIFTKWRLAPTTSAGSSTPAFPACARSTSRAASVRVGVRDS